MGAALRAADLVVSRAGASALGEYPSFGLPAILAPYPHAWDYQQVNAEYLEQHGAAVIIADGELTSRLVGVVREIINDSGKLALMSAAMQTLSCPEATHQIADLVMGLVSEKGV